MTASFRKALRAGALFVLMGSASAQAAECIAPANPGGGWDFTCRQIGRILQEIGVEQNLVQVTNMAGAGGGVAFTHVVSERNTDANLIVAASSATTTRLAQNAYAGMSADQVRWVGTIGGDPGVIVVGKDSPFRTLADLVEAVKADPSKVASAGGSGGGRVRPPQGADAARPGGLRRCAGGEIHRPRRRRRRDHPDGGRLHPGDDRRPVGNPGLHPLGRRAGARRAVRRTRGGLRRHPDRQGTGYRPGGDELARPLCAQGHFGRGIRPLDRCAAEGGRQRPVEAGDGRQRPCPYTLIGADFETFVNENIAEIREISREIGIIQ